MRRGAGFRLWVLVPAETKIRRLNRIRKKYFFVIPFTENVLGEPREARDLLFFSASKKQQFPRANSALRNDML